MKLILAVVQDKDSVKLNDVLVKQGFRVTKLSSTGGFLKEGNTTFLVGVHDEQVDRVIRLIKEHCSSRKQVITPMAPLSANVSSVIPQPVEVDVGGATVFVLPIDRYEHF